MAHLGLRDAQFSCEDSAMNGCVCVSAMARLISDTGEVVRELLLLPGGGHQDKKPPYEEEQEQMPFHPSSFIGKVATAAMSKQHGWQMVMCFYLDTNLHCQNAFSCECIS